MRVRADRHKYLRIRSLTRTSRNEEERCEVQRERQLLTYPVPVMSMMEEVKRYEVKRYLDEISGVLS